MSLEKSHRTLEEIIGTFPPQEYSYIHKEGYEVTYTGSKNENEVILYIVPGSIQAQIPEVPAVENLTDQ